RRLARGRPVGVRAGRGRPARHSRIADLPAVLGAGGVPAARGLVLHGRRTSGMTARTWLPALMFSALLAACGGSGSHRTVTHAAAPPKTVAVRHVTPRAPPPQALITAETENRLLVVDLPSGRVVRRLAVAPDPEHIAANSGACSS